MSELHQFLNQNSTFPAAIRSWEIHMADQGKSVYTIKAFRGDINLLAGWLPPDKTLGSVTTRDLTGFLDWMDNERKVPCSPKSYARRVTSIKSFFKWLKTYGVLESDPAGAINQKTVVAPLPEILTSEEYDRVMEAANAFRIAEKPDARYAVLLQLLLTTGLKKGEVLNLSANHIEADNPNEPSLFVRYAEKENRIKDRRIALRPEWLEAYHEYVEQYRITDKVFPWSPRRLEYLLEDIGKAAGLMKHLSFAMCRWTCAVQDHRAEMSNENIRTKLGISRVQWREVYNKIIKLTEYDKNQNADEK